MFELSDEEASLPEFHRLEELLDKACARGSFCVNEELMREIMSAHKEFEAAVAAHRGKVR